MGLIDLLAGLILAIAVVAVIWIGASRVVQWLEPRKPREPPDPAVQTLRDRLAKGEISVEEYEERLAALRATTPKPKSPYDS